MPSEIRSIGLTIRRLAKGTIDLVRWRAPVQLLKYATRTVWFKNVNTGYPVRTNTNRRMTVRPKHSTTTHYPESHFLGISKMHVLGGAGGDRGRSHMS